MIQQSVWHRIGESKWALEGVKHHLVKVVKIILELKFLPCGIRTGNIFLSILDGRRLEILCKLGCYLL